MTLVLTNIPVRTLSVPMPLLRADSMLEGSGHDGKRTGKKGVGKDS